MKTEISRQFVFSALLLYFLSMPINASELKSKLTDNCPNQAPDQQSQISDSPLLAILIPEIISAGVDMASVAIAEAAKTKTATLITDSKAFDMYKVASNANLSINRKPGCLIIYQPASMPAAANAASAAVPGWFSNARQYIPENSAPDIYLEIQLRPGYQNSGMHLGPQLLVVNRRLQDGFFLKNKRGYVIALSFKDADSRASYGAATLAFDDVPLGIWTRDGRSGTSMAPEWPEETMLPKMPSNAKIVADVSEQKQASAVVQEVNALLKQRVAQRTAVKRDDIADDAEYKAALQKFCKALDSEKAGKGADKLGDDRCPINVYIAKRHLATVIDARSRELGYQWADAYFRNHCSTSPGAMQDHPGTCPLPDPAIKTTGATFVSISVVETSEANAFAQSLAAIFDKKKGDIKTALNDKYNPDRRDELSDAAAVKARDARNVHQLAMLNVQQIEAQLQEAFDKPESARTGIRIQLARAKIDANKTSADAGLAFPFPEFN
ncbi:hypothetical protein [Janthinobacterium sp. 1_2014MBL_MicDiv]|uniref:hypothetical protein n=1 Tax=Janthinobacterium sp. 1_2014MBL_MicDiv TaxID=1644131 RepID=UPI0012EC3028|nr:hypothetical protein [Janthinobacterium sp. 1_2014MBL_MicDiv]